jgi:hypothetical protein
VAGSKRGGIPDIDNGGLGPVYQERDFLRGSFFTPLREHGPQQCTAGKDGDAYKKDLVDEEFHDVPMV